MGNPRNPHPRSLRRPAGIAGVGGVLVAAAAVSPVVPWHFGYLGLLLGLVAALVAVGAIGAPTALHPRRIATNASIDALRRLRGWHVVDAVEIDGVLTDHVVVAPAAVLAVVTAPEHDLATAEQAAQRVRRLVGSAAPDEVTVIPMIWACSPDGTRLARAHRVVAGVHLVDGNHPAAWLHLFREVAFAPGPRLELCAALEARAAEHRALTVAEPVGLVAPPEPAGA